MSKKYRFLIIQDEAQAPIALGAFFAQLECDICVCQNLSMALAQLNSQKFDVIILDLGLPAMSPLDMTRQIAALIPTSLHTDIIVLLNERDRPLVHEPSRLQVTLTHPITGTSLWQAFADINLDMAAYFKGMNELDMQYLPKR